MASKAGDEHQGGLWQHQGEADGSHQEGQAGWASKAGVMASKRQAPGHRGQAMASRGQP